MIYEPHYFITLANSSSNEKISIPFTSLFDCLGDNKPAVTPSGPFIQNMITIVAIKV
jgi:hypothetical protein